MHEIEGNHAFYNKMPAWHGLGKVFEAGLTIQEAAEVAYPWSLFKLPCQAMMGDYNEETGVFEPAFDDTGKLVTFDLADNFAIIRSDGKEIGKVGKDFGLLQPGKIFEGMGAIVETGLVELEAGGSLCGGKRMWILAKIKGADADIVGGDHIRGYVLFYTGFDGSLSVGLMRTNVRVVCANTLQQAITGRGEQEGFRLRHTSKVELRFDAAADTILAGLKGFKADIEVYRALANKRMSEREQEKLIRSVIAPKVVAAEERGEEIEIPAQTEAKIRHVIELLDTQAGLELVPAMRGTAWQAYNAVTEYLTHDYGRTRDSRLNGQWFGESAAMGRKALTMALEA